MGSSARVYSSRMAGGCTRADRIMQRKDVGEWIMKNALKSLPRVMYMFRVNFKFRI
jgi:hypothetical protein